MSASIFGSKQCCLHLLSFFSRHVIRLDFASNYNRRTETCKNYLLHVAECCASAVYTPVEPKLHLEECHSGHITVYECTHILIRVWGEHVENLWLETNGKSVSFPRGLALLFRNPWTGSSTTLCDLIICESASILPSNCLYHIWSLQVHRIWPFESRQVHEPLTFNHLCILTLWSITAPVGNIHPL